MIKYVDIEKDKEMLVDDLGLSERAKNVLKRWLKVKTFGDLLKVDYEVLENTRSMGKITLEEIKTLVHDKGYFLFNETVSWKEKREKFQKSRIKLLEDEGLDYEFARFFYINNFFCLDDIFYYGMEIFGLKGFGRVRQEEFKKFLCQYSIKLEEEDSTKILKQIKAANERKDDFNTDLLDIISIKEIGNLYIDVRKILINSGISTLNDLLSLDYNKLKDRLSDISNMELLELVSFLQSYGIELKGYDQTNYNTRPLKKEKTISTEIKLETTEQNKLENIKIKKELMTNLKELLVKYQELFNEVSNLGLKISDILNELEKIDEMEDVNKYVKHR